MTCQRQKLPPGRRSQERALAWTRSSATTSEYRISPKLHLGPTADTILLVFGKTRATFRYSRTARLVFGSTHSATFRQSTVMAIGRGARIS